MTHCPHCHRPLDRTTALIPGMVIWGCRGAKGHGGDWGCRRYAVEPPEGIDWEWLEGGPNLVERLKASAEAARRTVEMRLSGADDPRWMEVMG